MVADDGGGDSEDGNSDGGNGADYGGGVDDGEASSSAHRRLAIDMSSQR